jgi:hypothetical protein
VPAEQDGGAAWLLSEFPEPEQRYEMYCVLAYLRAREATGWLFTAADRGDRFRQIIEDLFDDPATVPG